jgi:hypothetical protein
MKKTAMVLTGLWCLCVAPARAAEQADETRFRAGEWQIAPFATYVDKVGNDDWGLGAAATFFLTERIGVGASTYWSDFHGTFFDNAAGEVYFRFPALKLVAPYGVASLGYQFDSEEWVETLGVGVDFRPFKNISAFSDIQWRFANETQNGVFLRLGVRISL